MKKLTAGEWWNRIGIFILLFILVGLIPLPLVLSVNATATMQLWGVVGYYFLYAAVIIGAIYCYHRDGNFVPTKFRLRNLGWVVGGFVFIIIMENLLLKMSSSVYNTTTSKNQEVIQNLMGSNHTVMITMAIGMVFFTPIVEETIFRGYLMNAFFKPDQWFLPIIVSGIAFALAHAQSNVFTFAVYLLMGMTLAFVYRKTGNLKTSMLLHGLNNLISVIALLSQMH